MSARQAFPLFDIAGLPPRPIRDRAGGRVCARGGRAKQIGQQVIHA
jgi:hypothetical protein